MTDVLVTGGTGALGRQVVPRLVAAGAGVRVLTRRTGASVAEGARPVRGDLLTGEGLAPALAGAGALVHCASDPRNTRVDTDGTRNLLEAARVMPTPPHVVHVSIVGIDRLSTYYYYRAKLVAENLVAESGLGWTVLRATQFHDLVLQTLAVLAKPPLALVPKGVHAQPVDTSDVAERLVPLALGEPAGRVPDIGGPQAETAAGLMRTYLEAAGLRRRLAEVPLPGTTMRGFRAGHHMPTDGTAGTRTFADFVREQVRPGEPVELSYYVKNMKNRSGGAAASRRGRGSRLGRRRPRPRR